MTAIVPDEEQCGRPTHNGTPCRNAAQGAYSIKIACLQHFTPADEELRQKLWQTYALGKIHGRQDAERRFATERRRMLQQFEDELGHYGLAPLVEKP